MLNGRLCRGLLRDYEPSDGTFSSTTREAALVRTKTGLVFVARFIFPLIILTFGVTYFSIAVYMYCQQL